MFWTMFWACLAAIAAGWLFLRAVSLAQHIANPMPLQEEIRQSPHAIANKLGAIEKKVDRLVYAQEVEEQKKKQEREKILGISSPK